MPSEPEYYGQEGSNDVRTLRERLRDYYDEADFVTVINIDSAPLQYQFMNPANEEFISNANYHGETYHKKPPTVVVLQPGETKLCPAYEADLMFEALIKKITSTKVAEDIRTGKSQAWQSANWNDPFTQKALIDEAFLGKQDLVGKFNENMESKKPEVEKDLDFSHSDVNPVKETVDVTPESARRGRPSKKV